MDKTSSPSKHHQWQEVPPGPVRVHRRSKTEPSAAAIAKLSRKENTRGNHQASLKVVSTNRKGGRKWLQAQRWSKPTGKLKPHNCEACQHKVSNLTNEWLRSGGPQTQTKVQGTGVRIGKQAPASELVGTGPRHSSLAAGSAHARGKGRGDCTAKKESLQQLPLRRKKEKVCSLSGSMSEAAGPDNNSVPHSTSATFPTAAIPAAQSLYWPVVPWMYYPQAISYPHYYQPNPFPAPTWMAAQQHPYFSHKMTSGTRSHSNPNLTTIPLSTTDHRSTEGMSQKAMEGTATVDGFNGCHALAHGGLSKADSGLCLVERDFPGHRPTSLYEFYTTGTLASGGHSEQLSGPFEEKSPLVNSGMEDGVLLGNEPVSLGLQMVLQQLESQLCSLAELLKEDGENGVGNSRYMLCSASTSHHKQKIFPSYLSFYMSSLSVCLSLSLHLSVCLFPCLFVPLSLSLTLCLHLSLSLCLSLLSVSVSSSLSVFLSLSICLSVFVCLSVSVHLSLTLSLSLSFRKFNVPC